MCCGSESEQIGDQFTNLLQRDGPDVHTGRLNDAIDAYGRREVRLRDTEPRYINLAQPPSPSCRTGHNHNRRLLELEHIIGGDDDRRSKKAASPLAGTPKSQRTTSPARIGDIACRSSEHGFVVSIQWGACKLRPQNSTTFPSDHLLELSVEGQPFTICEHTQGITGPDRDLDGSRIRHAKQYTPEAPSKVYSEHSAGAAPRCICCRALLCQNCPAVSAHAPVGRYWCSVPSWRTR